MKYLMLVLVLFASEAKASETLVLLGGSRHIEYTDNPVPKVNNTYGIGIEGKEYGFIIYKNSFNNTSSVAYAKYNITSWFTASINISTGYYPVINEYTDTNKSMILVYPTIGFTIGNIRLVTSYPVAKLTENPVDADIINIQYLIKF